MPRVKLSPELKEAISELPDQEKDKLIFRLLPSNAKLVERLIFELLEEGSSQEERREEVEKKIEKALKAADQYFYTPGLLLLALRDLSGDINRHVQATRDKYGEAALNLFMLVRALELSGEKVRAEPRNRSRTFTDYVIKRCLKIVSLLQKMHPDLHFDFQENLEKLGALLQQNPTLVQVARDLGLDLKALQDGEVPMV